MPVPGYDPEDVDELLEAHLDEDEVEATLDDAEWRAYQAGDEDLVDLLDDAEIERVLDERSGDDAA